MRTHSIFETLETRQMLSTSINLTYTTGPESAIVGKTLFYATAVTPRIRTQDGFEGGQLWKSNLDGSDPVLLGTFQAEPTWLTAYNGKLYFDGNLPGHGNEPCVSDGTVAGTKLLGDLYPVAANSDPHSYVQVDGNLFFIAQPEEFANELYEINGSGALTQVSPYDDRNGYTGIGDAFISGNTIFCFENGQRFGVGPDANAASLIDPSGQLQISGTDDAETITLSPSGNVTTLNVNGAVQTFKNSDFTSILITSLGGDDTIQLDEVTTPATIDGGAGNDTIIGNTAYDHVVLDNNDTVMPAVVLQPGTVSNPTPLITIGNTLYFTANDSSGKSWLWQSDGTTAGTTKLFEYSTSWSYANWLNFNGTLYIGGNGNLWQVNQSGVTKLFDGAAHPDAQLALVGGKLYYSTALIVSGNETQGELFVFDAPGEAARQLSGFQLNTGAGTFNDGPSLAVANDTLYFTFENYGQNDMSWYTTDGVSVTKLGWPSPGPGITPTDIPVLTLPSDSITIGNTRYYAFDDGTHGTELFEDDGSGGKLLADINSGADASSPDGLSYVNGKLLFAATTDTAGRQLYEITLQQPAVAATPSPVKFANGELSINGSDNDDSIILVRSPGNNSMLKVSVDGNVQAFNLADISLIVVNGNDGNDSISFNEKYGAINIASKLYGGAGNDTIIGGSGNDRIMGGDGDDWISGGAGNDIIYGEAGNDRLFGGDGKDYLDGGDGTNVIRGEGGVNTIVSDSILDDLRGNKGNRMILET